MLTVSRPSVVDLVLGRRDHGSAYGTERDIVSRDGTSIRVWRNGGTGPAVLIAPGLGTVPEAWPLLLEASCGYDVVSWYQRGTFGSARPADPRRVTLKDHTDDAVAVLNAVGFDRAVVAGWSMGVNTAFELALRAPERVAGIVGVAGVPGDTFTTIGVPLRVPMVVRKPGARTIARGLAVAGPALNAALRRIQVTEPLTRTLERVGVMRRSVDDHRTMQMLQRFVLQDWRWYMHLALSFSDHSIGDLSGVRCPVSLLSGHDDVLTAARAVSAVTAVVPQATVRELAATHFLPIEYPEVCVQEIRAMVERAS